MGGREDSLINYTFCPRWHRVQLVQACLRPHFHKICIQTQNWVRHT